MQIVIDIPEETYKDICYRHHIIGGMRSIKAIMIKLCKVIREGKPLPKKHGRLIDEREISLFDIHFKTEQDHARMIGRLNSAPTIVPAYYEEDNNNA